MLVTFRQITILERKDLYNTTYALRPQPLYHCDMHYMYVDKYLIKDIVKNNSFRKESYTNTFSLYFEIT